MIKVIESIYWKMKMKTSYSYQDVVKHLDNVLKNAQKYRKNKQKLVEVPSFYNDSILKIAEWNLYEMKEMLKVINVIRIDNFLPKLTLKDIQIADSLAELSDKLSDNKYSK